MRSVLCVLLWYFVDVGVGFADRAAAVFAVGFLRIYGFYMSASV
jgi:hypothetical protein